MHLGLTWQVSVLRGCKNQCSDFGAVEKSVWVFFFHLKMNDKELFGLGAELVGALKGQWPSESKRFIDQSHCFEMYG